MSHFKIKLIFTGVVFLCVITALEADQNPIHEQNPLKDLIDDYLEGFFLSGGVGYAISRADYLDNEVVRRSFTQFHWKVGYATSERLGVYVTSTLTSFAPKFGVMWYPRQKSRSSNQRYYLQALLRISSYESGADIQSVGGGFGYEFRPHFVFDSAVGYSRVRRRLYMREWGGTWEATELHVDHAMDLVISVNYRFY